MADTLAADTDKLRDFDPANYRDLQEAILAAFANERVDARLPESRPVLPSLHSQQTPDLIANEDGQAMLVYDKPLPDVVWWTEYDTEYNQLVFVTVAGQIMNFGMPIHPSVDKYLRHSSMMFLVQIDNEGNMVRVDERRVVVRKTGHA
jgi:hypothetical protein